MSDIKIAAAQLYSVKGNIEKNIENHLKAVEKAAEHNVDFMIFPELSLTGYELELADSLAVDINDERLLPLAKAAEEYDITLAAGIPIKSDSLPKLGLAIFSPNGERMVYCKMNVHSSEDKFFANGEEYKILKIKNEKIGLAICADINNPNHLKSYAEMGATIYAASVLISEEGYLQEIDALHKNAIKHNIPVLVANHNKPTGKYISACKSGAFFPDGSFTTVQKEETALLILEKKSDQWLTSIENINF